MGGIIAPIFILWQNIAMLDKTRAVFVAMSGGVDSSVAAALLKQQGYEVTGVHMHCYNVDGCAKQDAEDARRAAEVLGIPFYVFDFEKEYKAAVVDYMVRGYKQGITPNPDVMCNKEIKFGLFLKKALSLGADYIATGHYVRLLKRKNILSSRPATRSLVIAATRPSALRAKTMGHALAAPGVSGKNIFSLGTARDKNKDQSYFLWTLTQEQLRRCLFPIGDYKKPEVRRLAKKFGLPNAEKKDSQGICFLGQVRLRDFLQRYIKPKNGHIVDINGNILGAHNGAYLYTIGQRGGLNIGGTSRPLYVAGKDVKKNIVIVAEGDDHPALYKQKIDLANVNFLRPMANKLPATVFVRVRYRQPPMKAELHKLKVNSYKLIFASPQKFIAPGQSAVFYETRPSPGFGLKMLGGGIIKSV